MSEPERKTGEEEEEESRTEREDRKMIIRQSFENMTPLPTLSADQVKAFIDGTTRTCTLLFIQRHPKPESGEEGIRLSSIQDQVVLEVKLPFESAFSIGVYLYDVLKKGMIDEPNKIGFDFGPLFHPSESPGKSSG